MNNYELMQDFEISLIETLNQKETELSNLFEDAKTKLERFLIILKFYDNTFDISNYGTDGNKANDIIKEFIYNLANLNNEEKGLLYLQYLYFYDNYVDARLQFLICKDAIGKIKILFRILEGFEDSEDKMRYMECIFKAITTNLIDINFDMQSLLDLLNGNYEKYSYIKDVIIYIGIISSMARVEKTTPQNIFERIEEMKAYPEVQLLVAKYRRKIAELEVHQEQEQETKAI